MALSLNFTISDDIQATRSVNAFCVSMDYPNRKLQNETKAQFVKRMMIEYFRGKVKEGEIKIAVELTIKDTSDSVDLITIS